MQTCIAQKRYGGSVDDQLKQLFDYTKFHIGMYVTLIAAMIGLFSKGTLGPDYAHMLTCIQFSVVAFVIAGMAGGLVASSIPYFTSFQHFQDAKLGPGRWHIVPAIWCTYIEHFAFWTGCLISVGGFLVPNSKP